MRSARTIMAALALSLLLAAGLACGSQTTSNSDRNDLGTAPTAFVEYDLPHMTIADWTDDSDLIVAGTVVKVDEPRWNSADGKAWSPRDEESLPIVYQTFYVQPEKILKGTAQWGTPVAFRAWWNTSTGTGPLTAGDTVVAFGALDQGRYGGVYQPVRAYWLTSDNNSLWLKQGRAYENQGLVKDQAERTLTLAELEAGVQEAVTAVRTVILHQSVEVGWGKVATFDGILQITATAPQLDSSGRPVPSVMTDPVVLYSTVIIKNIGRSPRSYDPQWFGVTAGDQVWSGGSDGVETSVGPPLVAGTLQPGETVTGTVPFQFESSAASYVHDLVFDTSPSQQTEQPVLHVEWS